MSRLEKRLRYTIDFAAIGDEPVDVVFLLLPETGDGARLNALVGIAGAEALRRLRHGP
jgi:hypothetical protein